MPALKDRNVRKLRRMKKKAKLKAQAAKRSTEPRGVCVCIGNN